MPIEMDMIEVEKKDNDFIIPTPESLIQEMGLVKLANELRARLTNQLIEENLPKWSLFLRKKFKFFRKRRSYFVGIKPLTLYENDYLHERIVFSKNDEEIATRIFRMRFK